VNKTARDIMTREVIAVDRNLPVNNLIDFMLEKKISSAPVLDEKGKLIGIVTKTDILGHCMDIDLDVTVKVGLKDILDSTPDYSDLEVSSSTDQTVESIMTRNPVTVSENTPVKELASLMIKKNIHRLIVTRGKRVTGILSTLDVLYFVAGIEKVRE